MHMPPLKATRVMVTHTYRSILEDTLVRLSLSGINCQATCWAFCCKIKSHLSFNP